MAAAGLDRTDADAHTESDPDALANAVTGRLRHAGSIHCARRRHVLQRRLAAAWGARPESDTDTESDAHPHADTRTGWLCGI